MLTDGHPDAPLLMYVGRLGVEKRLRDLKQLLERVPTRASRSSARGRTWRR